MKARVWDGFHVIFINLMVKDTVTAMEYDQERGVSRVTCLM